MTPTVRDLSRFSGVGYDKGRSLPVQALWILTSSLFMSAAFPQRVRPHILRLFGARVGRGVVIRKGVDIHWPWKLIVGDNVWIGVRAYILNLELVTLESNVCISQEVLLCTGSHDVRSPTFEYANSPILIKSGAWICARAIVLKGVTVGESVVIPAGVVQRHDRRLIDGV